MKKNIRVIFVMFLVLVLAVSGISFAWFMENMDIKVSSGENMNISVGGDLEVAWHSETPQWGTELSTSVKDIAMLDCSGNGKDFFIGEVGEDGQLVPETMRQLTGEELEGAVLEFAIDLRTSHKMDVYLGSLSAVAPKIKDYQPDTTQPNNNSFYGKFSADWIAAAARVAFYEVKYNTDGTFASQTPICTWIPNANVRLEEGTDDKGNAITILNQNAEPKLEYEYCRDVDADNNPITATHKYDPTSTANTVVLAQGDQLCTADKGTNGANVVYSANQAPKIASFTQDGVMEVKHLVVRIWFDGYDTECTEVMLGGKVTYTLSFAGMMPKTALTEEETTDFTADKIKANTDDTLTIPESLNGKIIYSLNGIDYYDYTAEKTFESGTTVYLRIKETTTTYASDILSVTFS